MVRSMSLKERFKSYLEGQFRQIAPTKSAMEYRISMLNRMLDREQELRIKGMNDDELIYNTVIAELGDLPGELRGYENKIVKRAVNRRFALLGSIVSVAWALALVLSYLIVGFVTHIWHPTWLIIVGGLLLSVEALLVAVAVRQSKRKWYLPLRATLAGIIVILSVILFLFMQLVGGINGSYLVFLAMVAAIAVSDTAAAFASGSRFKWAELPLGVEVVCVMLYVILGISLSAQGTNIWHPGWIMCLGGVVVAIAELIAVCAKSAREKKKEEVQKNTAVDESYWTKWE